MPGLAGIAGSGEAVCLETARRMVSRLGLGVSSASVDSIAVPGLAMAADSRPEGLWGPRVAADGKGLALGINGEVFGLQDEEGIPTESFPRGPDSRPAELLLDLYRRDGLAMVPRLRGFFSLAIWDGPRETLHLVSDRFALRPIFYLRQGSATRFGSEVKAVLAASEGRLEPDERGLSDFVVLGMPLGDRSFFKDLRLVLPASIVSIGPKGSTSRSYWNLRYGDARFASRDLDGAARKFAESFEAVISDCVADGGSFELPLSGGMDSRCIGAAASGKARLRSYTMGGMDCEDLRIGPRVAEHLGFPNLVSHLSPQDFIDWIAPSVYITDGMYSPVNAPILAIARLLPADARVVLDGANSFDGYYRAYEFLFHRLPVGDQGLRKLALRICPHPYVGSRSGPRSHVLEEGFLAGARENAELTLHEMAMSVPAAQREDRFGCLDFLDLGNRLRRFNMMGTVLLRTFCEVRQPLFDSRIISLVTSFPKLLRSREKLVLGRYLNLKDPFLASLPYERSGLPADAGLARQLVGYVTRTARKTAGKFSPGLRPAPRVVVDYINWIKNDQSLQGFIREVLLDPRSKKRSYIRGSEIEPFLEDLFAGRSENLFLAMRLVSLEFWHRYFLEGETPPSFPPFGAKDGMTDHDYRGR